MPRQVTCRSCQTPINIPDELAGDDCRCPKCSEVIEAIPGSRAVMRLMLPYVLLSAAVCVLAGFGLLARLGCFDESKEARDRRKVKELERHVKVPCKTCNGTGRESLGEGKGTIMCLPCRGTGKRDYSSQYDQ